MLNYVCIVEMFHVKGKFQCDAELTTVKSPVCHLDVIVGNKLQHCKRPQANAHTIYASQS
jgi:hypothetical protein